MAKTNYTHGVWVIQAPIFLTFTKEKEGTNLVVPSFIFCINI